MSRRVVDVSVVVSTFNRCRSLPRLLDSLLQQAAPGIHYEIVVVDNNCTDRTRDIVAEYVRRHPDRVRYAFERRRGVSYGRNAGVRAARADLIAFTDDDNSVTRTWLSQIVALMRANPDIAGVGGRVLPQWPRTPPAWIDRRHWSPLAILDYGERAFPTGLHRPLCLLTANLALRRSVFERVGGFSTQFPRCQDHELLLRVWRAGERVLYAPDVVVFAHVDPVRLTRRYHRRWHARHGHYAAAMRIEEACDEHGQLRTRPADTARFRGTPGYVYADAARHAWDWMLSTLARDRRALHHEHRLRYLAAYVRRTAQLSREWRPGLARDAAEFVAAHIGRRARALRMAPARYAAAHAVVTCLLIGSAYDIATGTEHWPFSPYPMFSSVEREPVLDSLVIAGVTADAATELPLRDRSFVDPFDQCRLVTAFQRVRNRRDDGTQLRTMLGDVLARYERLRHAGRHEGPALRAIRIYAAHWTLDPHAANVDTPDSMTLLGEVAAAGQ